MFPSKNFFFECDVLWGKNNVGDLPLGMNSVVNTEIQTLSMETTK